jgi:hypothetical protein
MKITREELKNLIKEEVSKIKRKTILENKKEEILNQLRVLNEGENAPYDSTIPLRELTKEEKLEVIKLANKKEEENPNFDPKQDFALNYKSSKHHHLVTVIGNLDGESENNIWDLKIPEDAYIVGIVGNMNYTDAYKSQENSSLISEEDGIADDFGLTANLVVTRIASKEVDSQEFYDYLINNKEEVLNFVKSIKEDIPENTFLKILMLNPKESLKLLNV